MIFFTAKFCVTRDFCIFLSQLCWRVGALEWIQRMKDSRQDLLVLAGVESLQGTQKAESGSALAWGFESLILPLRGVCTVWSPRVCHFRWSARWTWEDNGIWVS